MKQIHITLELARAEMKCWDLISGKAKECIWRSYVNILNVEKEFLLRKGSMKSTNPVQERIEKLFEEYGEVTINLRSSGLGTKDEDISDYVKVRTLMQPKENQVLVPNLEIWIVKKPDELRRRCREELDAIIEVPTLDLKKEVIIIDEDKIKTILEDKNTIWENNAPGVDESA